MDSTLPALHALFERCRPAGVPLALATVIGTQGSTYRKPGARMLFARDGSFAGLLSGGCLENDLQEQASQVIEERRARIVEYDSRSSDDAIWGLGLGCEGAMRILLQPVTAATRYEPLPRLLDAGQRRRGDACATIVASRDSGWPVGRCWFSGDPADSPVAREIAARCVDLRKSASSASVIVALEAGTAIEAFLAPLEPNVRVLLLGGGPDALAVVNQAALLGWAVTVVDHRPAYADAARLGAAERVILTRPEDLAIAGGASAMASGDSGIPRLEGFDAAVVMSHHLTSDLAYLRHLARSSVGYVGLLGPAARRERLHRELGDLAARLDGRLFGPVGLDIGAATPETIALAIVAEIHACLRGREGRSYSAVAPASAPASASASASAPATRPA